MPLSGISVPGEGFEVSAVLKDGEVERVTILSHKGHPCRVENPWPGKSVKVSYEYGRPDEVHFGEYLNIELYKEEHAELFGSSSIHPSSFFKVSLDIALPV